MTVSVLHVDDDPEFLDLAARALGSLDDAISVTSVADGDAATELLARRRFDCIVSDNVPGPDGAPFVTTAARASPGTPIILLSGSSPPELRDGAARTVLADAVQKGSGDVFADLVARIERHTAPRRDGVAPVLADPGPQVDASPTTTWALDLSDDPVADLTAVLADLRGCAVEELPPIVYDVDVEALLSLLDSGSTSGVVVKFAYDGFLVTIAGDGLVVAEDQRGPAGCTAP